MKIVITESKRDKLVMKWLNDKYSDLVPRKVLPNYYEFRQDDRSVFSVIGDVLFLGNPNFISDMSELFGLNRKTMLPIFKYWMLETYGVEINDVK